MTDYHPVVQQIYIAYFGRPADPTGLANFAAELDRLRAPSDIQALNTAYVSNPTVRALIDSFGNSEESMALYNGDTTSFVTAIYKNVLNRAPDADGLNFWVRAIDQNGLTRGNASFSIMAGALANTTPQGRIDAELINRRVTAGTSFTNALSTPALVETYKGNNAAAIARDMLSTVTEGSDGASIQAAINQTLPFLAKAAAAPSPSEIPAPVAGTIPTTMLCVDGPAFQCSGSAIVRIDNGVGLSSSGVQVHARSTTDLATPNPSKVAAFGLAASTEGIAEVRLAKDSSGNVPTVALLLNNLGLSWDGKVERPPIIETFRTTQGRTGLAANGALTSAALPPSSDLAFYDYATRGAAATQANYANNAYFPRAGNPSRCPTGVTPCPDVESVGIQVAVGDWRAGGANPDVASADRLHEDGDVHAGNGPADAGGNPTVLPGGSGIGVPFPGSKGYRQFFNWGLRYANLSTWSTQDTVLHVDWGATGEEHNKSRRGAIAFGDVTNPASVPASGTATYTGLVYGWRGNNGLIDPSVYRGTATVTVDFATRRVNVSFKNAAIYQATATPVSLPGYSAAAAGTVGTNVANYFTGDVATAAFSGGLSGRFFGPVVSEGVSGAGPAEIAGTLTLRDKSDDMTLIGGFIGRKQ